MAQGTLERILQEIKTLKPEELLQVQQAVQAQLAPTSYVPAEEHVLQEMRHPCFAVAFMPRPDEIGDVDRSFGFARIGKQENLKSVVQPVFGDSLDRRDFRDTLRKRLGECDRKNGNAEQNSSELNHLR